ncbi:hypothetical protein Ancab_021807 [Ancistrocladus abbreviatus]
MGGRGGNQKRQGRSGSGSGSGAGAGDGDGCGEVCNSMVISELNLYDDIIVQDVCGIQAVKYCHDCKHPLAYGSSWQKAGRKHLNSTFMSLRLIRSGEGVKEVVTLVEIVP